MSEDRTIAKEGFFYRLKQLTRGFRQWNIGTDLRTRHAGSGMPRLADSTTARRR